MKLKLLIVFLITVTSGFCQSLQSPDNFLGYSLGDRYTPHYKLVNYFQYVAKAMPGQVKLEQYGETNEGRPLLLATVASVENFGQLESIRKNNLRLTGLLNDSPGLTEEPAVVWLSYNVHGNEPSSSEVAMKVLYELLNPANAESKKYLKNTIVLIDPCLNPDGRERYINWFNSVVGKNTNPNPDAREHSEPWPGGRTNHYNFDLNRDWAWQTQIETQQRIKKYNEWMPHIHCDYHEQGHDDSYYFAPATEPYHEVITPWQRNFQVEMGKNHAKYFDANGWLYFTKEIFDLFYPSYGDTYPIYNGAIGMTFEEAGHSRAGTAIITKTGDTLTLKDRIDHHYTTSMSTLEVSSNNANKIVAEFKKYYDDARNNGVGEYKAFVITDTNQQKLNRLKKLLDANQIQYGLLTSGNLKGYNYFSGKEENFSANNSLAISIYQPKANLTKVLFEPHSKLMDSVTYDITAWSLPYVYGIQGYAVKEKINFQRIPDKSRSTVLAPAYAYAIRYQSFEDAKILAALLRNNVKVRYAETDFTINGKKWERGTLVVLKNDNESKIQSLSTLADRFGGEVAAIPSGFVEKGSNFGSSKIHYIAPPKVAMITGTDIVPEAAGEVWNLFDQELNYPLSLINLDDVANVNWKNFDVLILPNGKYKALLEKDGAFDLKNWVEQGGKLVALESAVAQLADSDWGIRMKKSEDRKDDTLNPYADAKPFSEGERKGIMSNVTGAIYRVSLDNSHPLAFGYSTQYFLLKQDANVYEFMKDGWNVGVIKGDALVAGFVGSKVKDKIKDAAVLIVQNYQKGSVVYFPDNPIFRSFWENGKLLMSNAVFFVGQ